MGQQDTRAILEQMYEALEAGDTERVDALRHEDYVQEWPQSGERIRGKANAKAIVDNYPGMPTMAPRRVVCAGNICVVQLKLDYGGKPVHGVSLLEFRDGKLARQTDYFADPFEAPAWRAKWVERFDPDEPEPDTAKEATAAHRG